MKGVGLRTRVLLLLIKKIILFCPNMFCFFYFKCQEPNSAKQPNITEFVRTGPNITEFVQTGPNSGTKFSRCGVRFSRGTEPKLFGKFGRNEPNLITLLWILKPPVISQVSYSHHLLIHHTIICKEHTPIYIVLNTSS